MFFYQVHGLLVLYYSRPVSTMTSLKQATVSRSFEIIDNIIKEIDLETFTHNHLSIMEPY